MQAALSSQPNWPELVFEEAFMKNCERLAQKRFNHQALEDECINYVIGKLSDDEWGRCQHYEGKSKPTTFLYTLVNNLIEEFARSKFGRPRPPTWLKAQGELWVSLWKAVCLERQMVQSVAERFAQNGARAIELVKEAITTIKARIPTCGQAGAGECNTEDISGLADGAGHTSSDTANAMSLESAAARLYHVMMQNILSDNKEELASISEQNEKEFGELLEPVRQKLEALKQNLQLNDQETVLLRLVYVDGLSKSKAAVAMGLPSHQGGRLVNDALARIQDAMQGCGLGLNDLLDLL